ncbi:MULTISPECIES: M48 family metalloprotease [unclassified Inquilinus]|uniref:M48 family metalloprotease n=1 Tax=unclassified Inquilinus TaxID=2645927 RepID=UPI003F8F032A
MASTRREFLLSTALLALAPRLAAADAVLAEGAKDVQEEFGGPYQAPALRDRVARIGQRVADAETGGTMRVAVDLIDSDRVNAVALPDGRILVTRGLLALARSEAEVAAVLAHEIGHVVADHARLRAQRAQTRPDIAEPSGEADFDQAQERQADRIGIEAMAAAGYDPGAAPAFLARLDAEHRLVAALVGRPELASAAANGADHPETADRVAAARAQAAALPEGESGEAEWLAATDGLPWGESPGQIPFRGQAVIDPVARFRWDAPPGVALMRQRRRVMGVGPDESVILFDHLSQPGALPARLYLERVWGKAVGGVRDVEALDLGGFPAARGRASVAGASGAWDVLLVMIETSAERRDRFTVLTRAGSPAQAPARAAVDSFRRISAAEAAKVRPRRLAIAKVRPGDTVASLVGRMRVEAAEDRFRLLNDGDRPAPGSLVKLIVE